MSGGALLVTTDDSLIAAVPRLCALAGVHCEVDRDSSAARAAWRYAAVILVGAEVARALAAARLPRRERVLVLTAQATDAACWQSALQLGADAVLRLPEDEAELVDRLRTPPASTLGVARVIAVMGGRGGAGASTLATALAMTAGRSGSAVLLDGDPLGGGLDVLVGAESAPGLRWDDLAATRGRLDAGAFASAICTVGGIGLVSWGRPVNGRSVDVEGVSAVLDAASRAFATVVVDVARSLTPLSERCLEAATESVVIVPADVRSVSATAALLASFGRRLGTPALVVRDPGGAGLSAKDIAASLGMSLTATLRSDPNVHAAAQRGEPPLRRGRCGLTQLCELVLSIRATRDAA